MLLVFGVATFVGAWLVFLVQPTVAKMVAGILVVTTGEHPATGRRRAGGTRD